jgi:hypothetical protein
MPPEHTRANFRGKRLGHYADSFVKLRFPLAGLDVYTPARLTLDVYRFERHVSQL